MRDSGEITALGGVVEMADTADLESAELGSWGFKSLHPHFSLLIL